MTWVIGVPAVGRGLLLGDIALSVRSTAIPQVGARKVHALGRRGCIGFAGSALIGFELVEDLRGWAQTVGADLIGALPEWVAATARSYETRFPPRMRALGSQLLVLHAQDATRDDGVPMGFRTVRGRRIEFLSAGNERPVAVEIAHGRASAIGSGDSPAAYADRLNSTIARSLVAAMENDALAQRPGGDLLFAKLMALRVTEAVHEQPVQGISEQFFVAVLGGDRLVFTDNSLPANADGQPQPGAPALFPPVAHDAVELARLLGQLDVDAAGVIA